MNKPVPALSCSLLAFTMTLGLVTAARSVRAQDAPARQLGVVPREVAREATAAFNAAATKRVRGNFTLANADTVRGDLAVLNGTARIGGVVTGRLIVLNGDVTLIRGSRVEGSLTVIGGAFESPDRPSIGGVIRVWSARYRYREDADTLVADLDRELIARWARWQRDDPNESLRQFFVTTAKTYNRVEGLPIYFGPRAHVRNGDTRVEAELFGIFRTSDQLDFARVNFGHRTRLELRQGRNAGFLAGGRAFDEVDAVERWQLSESEVGLASFVATRDYRDYWRRHGAQGYAGIFGPAKTELRMSFGEERWTSLPARDVPSLFYSNVAWRRNPIADNGVLKLLTLSGQLDTRNRGDNPASGWLLHGEYERGDGTFSSIAPTTLTLRVPVSRASANVTYARALFDLRRYNRLGPGAQLNMRVVGGGWLSGDALPVQRRFAVSGLDALPGFDFRQLRNATDVGTCASGSPPAYALLGRPALCERMVLLQAEWKGDFRFDPFGDKEGFGHRRWTTGRFRADGAVVAFVNSGRGWLVNDAGPLNFAKGRVPPLSSWDTDVGGGFDFGTFGVYVAKAVSTNRVPANVYVRLGHRF